MHIKWYIRLSLSGYHHHLTSLFRSVISSWLNSSFFLNDLLFFMSIGNINEAFRFLHNKNHIFSLLKTKVTFSSFPTLNVLFNYEITFLWNLSFPQNIKSSSYIDRIPIKLAVASCQRNCSLSYTLTIPFWFTHDWLSCTRNDMHHLIYKYIFSPSILVTLDILLVVVKEIPHFPVYYPAKMLRWNQESPPGTSEQRLLTLQNTQLYGCMLESRFSDYANHLHNYMQQPGLSLLLSLDSSVITHPVDIHFWLMSGIH